MDRIQKSLKATGMPNFEIGAIRRYIVFVTVTVVAFAMAYYALMEQSIRYSDAINADFAKVTQRKRTKPPIPAGPAGWLYLGEGEALEQSRDYHDVLSALYFSLSVQSTLGPPHYPPNKAWKLLTGLHILFVLTAAALSIS